MPTSLSELLVTLGIATGLLCASVWGVTTMKGTATKKAQGAYGKMLQGLEEMDGTRKEPAPAVDRPPVGWHQPGAP